MTVHRRRALLVLVLGLAAAARLSNYHGVFSGAEVVLINIDPYYQLRRIWLTVLHFPHVPHFDHFVNAPEGATIYWGPVFALLVASFAWAAGLGAPDFHFVAAVSAWAPVVLGVLNVAVVYLAGREAFSPGAGLVAAAIVALSPLDAYHISPLGNADHSVLEILSLSLATWLFLRSTREPGRPLLAAVAGLVLVLGMLTIAGVIIEPALLAGAALAVTACGWIAGGVAAPGRAVLKPLLALLLAASIGLLPFAVAGARGPFGPFSFLTLSLFQEAVLLILLAAALAAAGVNRRLAGPRPIPVNAIRIALALLVLAAVWFWFWPNGPEVVRAGKAYLFGSHPLNREVLEAKPITFWPPLLVAYEGTPFLFLGPLFAGAALWRFLRGRCRDAGLGLTAWLAVGTAPLLIAQFHKFGAYHVVPLAWIAGWAFTAAAEGTRRRRAAAGVALVVLLAPSLLLLRPMRMVNGHPKFSYVNEALQWMRYNTPPTRGLRNALERPEYAVLASLEFGHWINVIGERANIASSFGLGPRHLEGVRRTTAFFIEADETRAAAMAARWGARYVLVTPIAGQLYVLAPYAGRAGTDFVDWSARPPHHDAFFHMMATRMLYADGTAAQDAGGEEIPPLARFRVVYESPDRFDWNTSEWGFPPPGFLQKAIAAAKIYERVPGAVLSGSTPRGFRPVQARVEVRTNIGRIFTWSVSALSGSNGRFALRVPYATGERWVIGRTAALGPVHVTCDGHEVKVEVPEQAVTRGETVPSGCGP